MKVFYHHVSRTSGTSISNIAQKNYKDNVFFLNGNTNTNHLIDELVGKNSFFIVCDSLCKEDTEIKTIINLCDVDFISIRNPISRFESLYNFWNDTNPNDAPYMMGDKKLTIDEFYLKCKEQENREFFLNIQHKYFNLYDPKEIVTLESFSDSIQRLKDIGIFTEITEEDLIPANESNSNYKLSENMIEDYKTNFPEDFLLYG